jgi:hypothetical protein
MGVSKPDKKSGRLAKAVGSPVRVQLSRKKGWKLPPNTVKVDRATMWGNHFQVVPQTDAGWRQIELSPAAAFRCFTAAEAVARYEYLLREVPRRGGGRLFALEIMENIHKRCGKHLACWCPLNEPCHADVMLRLVNP